MIRCSAILLAAGASRRMGAVNKLALPLNGVPLVRRSAMLLLELDLTEIVVVTGYHAAATQDLLRGLPVTLVHNPHHRDGQMTSVHRGLAALQADCDGVFVCLADQPLLEVDDLLTMRDAFAARPQSVLVPTFEGRRGNPIVLPYAQRSRILAGERNLGCRRLIDKHPEFVNPFPMHNDHCVFDLDTPEAYLRWQMRNAAPQPTGDAVNYG